MTPSETKSPPAESKAAELLELLAGKRRLLVLTHTNPDPDSLASGLGLQLLFATLIILVPGGRDVFDFLSRIFVKIISFALDGAYFIFAQRLHPRRRLIG